MNIKLKGIYIFKIYEVEKSDDKCFKFKKKKPPNLVKSALKNHKHPKNKFQKNLSLHYKNWPKEKTLLTSKEKHTS
jgi:hypothetical protein